MPYKTEEWPQSGVANGKRSRKINERMNHLPENRLGTVRKWVAGLWKGFVKLPWPKIVRWAIFGVVLGILPLGAKAFFLKAFSEAKALNLAHLTAQGELYFVAAFLAAATVGELIESLIEGRTKPKNKLAVVMMTVAILGTLVVAFAAVVEFASVAATASANKNMDEAFVWHTSLWTFGFAVVTSCACVVFTGD